MCQDAHLLRDFAQASRADLHKMGHGAAMSKYCKALPPDPRVNPKGPEHKRYALGWSLVAMPCPVVDLNNKPDGGVTQVALPFLNFRQ